MLRSLSKDATSSENHWITAALAVKMDFASHYLGSRQKAQFMNHLNYIFKASKGDTAEVTIDRAANVMLMDSLNYANYKRGSKYRYYGGHATRSPVRLAIPGDGDWHVVIDLGGGAGKVRADVQLLGGVPA